MVVPMDGIVVQVMETENNVPRTDHICAAIRTIAEVVRLTVARSTHGIAVTEEVCVNVTRIHAVNTTWPLIS